ncbi:uncharacterized protein LOC130015539 [Mercurialis annua]|uniref:uncharacterized protein LOC130015539 n=1 Tax=Mercurialis annua TaxID=3986 RepID=UPI0024AD15A8|nr:uncharacterized protein LOC130015539 [Mercurialis annua]
MRQYRYKDTLHNMKPDKKEGSVSADTWASWKRDWDTAEAKKKSDIARANRMSEPSGAGTGPVRHTAGSRSATRHKTVMTEELGREPTLAELHVRLHLTKADRTAAGEGSLSTPETIDENDLFLSLEAIKKQRVYGIGSASASYIGQSSRLRRGGSSQTQQQAVVSEEIEQRIAREVKERLEQRIRTLEAGFGERVEQRIRTLEAGFDERIHTELVRLMTTLPPELRPQFPPPPPPPADDTTSLG